MKVIKFGRSLRCSLLLLFAFVISVPSTFAQTVACLDAPRLPHPEQNVVRVSTVGQLQSAVNNASNGTTILIAPGNYPLAGTLVVRADNVSIIGDSARCDEINLIGRGMENSNHGPVQHGIFTTAKSLTVRNLTIRDFYFSSIIFNAGSESPDLYNLRLLNAGSQFIKGNKGNTDGTDDGSVQYTIMEYTDGPPRTDRGGGTGYTNGVDIHGGKRWLIRNNVFKNFHTPDNADNLNNPAILMWRGAADTVSEGNVFINVDRAIAYGLQDDNANGKSHRGGIIRNNMIYYAPGVFSEWRKQRTDAAILVWDSPGSQVFHNTVLTNDNPPKSIEFRWDTTGVSARNNLVDAPISGRAGVSFASSNNQLSVSASAFVEPEVGNLRLSAQAAPSISTAPFLADAALDIDDESRASTQLVMVGADQVVDGDEVVILAPPSPPMGFEAEIVE